MAHLSETLKEKGNAHFRKGEFAEAESYYGQAIQKNSSNALLYTNRANARLKQKKWMEVIDDCLRSIELHRENMKGFYYLGTSPQSLRGKCWHATKLTDSSAGAARHKPSQRSTIVSAHGV